MKPVIIMIGGKSHNGKGTVASDLKWFLGEGIKDSNIIQCSLSTYIRTITKEDFYWDGKDTPEARKFMAEVYRLGTECLYPYHMARRVWERDIQPELKSDKDYCYDIAIVESFRELVNYEYFAKLQEVGIVSKIITIRVERPDYDDVKNDFIKNHVSETDLDNFNFNHYLINDGDMVDLHDKTKELAQKIKEEIING